MHYYTWHPGDFIRDTSHLSPTEECFYRRLLDSYYATERALPGDATLVSRLARAGNLSEKRAVATVLKEFFELRDDGYHNKRADAEIAKFQAKSGKRSDAARTRWDKGKDPGAMQMHSTLDANAMLSKIQEPTTTNHDPGTSNQNPPPMNGLAPRASQESDKNARLSGSLSEAARPSGSLGPATHPNGNGVAETARASRAPDVMGEPNNDPLPEGCLCIEDVRIAKAEAKAEAENLKWSKDQIAAEAGVPVNMVTNYRKRLSKLTIVPSRKSWGRY
jgi:uncharacterized protein YdaU (DUF1376 family)